MSEEEVPVVSRACKVGFHTYSMATTYRCDSMAYPGPLSRPGVSCECGCHRGEREIPGARP